MDHKISNDNIAPVPFHSYIIYWKYIDIALRMLF